MGISLNGKIMMNNAADIATDLASNASKHNENTVRLLYGSKEKIPEMRAYQEVFQQSSAAGRNHIGGIINDLSKT